MKQGWKEQHNSINCVRPQAAEENSSVVGGESGCSSVPEEESRSNLRQKSLLKKCEINGLSNVSQIAKVPVAYSQQPVCNSSVIPGHMESSINLSVSSSSKEVNEPNNEEEFGCSFNKETVFIVESVQMARASTLSSSSFEGVSTAAVIVSSPVKNSGVETV
jgi:hypothetical protein